MHNCLTCAAELTDGRKKFCSIECRNNRACEARPDCPKPTYGHTVCPMHQKRMEAWGSYEVRPPKPCGWCGIGFIPTTNFAAYCSRTCRSERRDWYNKEYFSDEVKKVERSIRRGLKSPAMRSRKNLGGEVYNRYAAFIRMYKYKARRAGVRVVAFTEAQLEFRMSMFGFRCWICGGSFEAIDHVKPLAAGGAHMLSNLRPTCTQCNARKWTSWPLADVARKFSIWERLTDDLTVSRLLRKHLPVEDLE